MAWALGPRSPGSWAKGPRLLGQGAPVSWSKGPRAKAPGPRGPGPWAKAHQVHRPDGPGPMGPGPKPITDNPVKHKNNINYILFEETLDVMKTGSSCSDIMSHQPVLRLDISYVPDNKGTP